MTCVVTFYLLEKTAHRSFAPLHIYVDQIRSVENLAGEGPQAPHAVFFAGL